MRKVPNINSPERLSIEEVQALIDRLPESDELLRNDLLERLQATLGICIKDNSWLELHNILDTFFYKIYEENYMLDHVKSLPEKDRLMNFLTHFNNCIDKIKDRMANNLGYSVKILDALFQCDSNLTKPFPSSSDRGHNQIDQTKDITLRGKCEIEQALESERKKLVEAYRLKANTTFEQIGTWLKSVDTFEIEEKTLRIHFIDRLRLLLVHRKIEPEALEMAIGKTQLSDETTWSDIDEVIQRILMADYGPSLSAAQDELAEALGFPSEKYTDMIACVERGMALERGYRNIPKK